MGFEKIRFFRADDITESMKQFINQAETLSQEKFQIEQLIYYWYSKGFVLPGWRTRGHSRFCPFCLSENAYHRLIWCISYFTYCKRHSALMKEECASCNRKTTLSGVINDCCESCGATLSLSNTEIIVGEELPFSLVEQYTVGNSPILQEYLTAQDQLLLTQRVAFYLCTRTKVFSLTLDHKERRQLVQNGYVGNVLLLKEVYTKSQELLQRWPINLVLFLKENYEDFNESREIFRNISTLDNKSINRLIAKTMQREGQLVSYSSFLKEHMIFDSEYINVIDFAENRGICIAVVSMIVSQHSIETEIHPRNKKTIIHVNWLDFISKKASDYQASQVIISIGSVAILWRRTEQVARGLCTFLKLQSKIIYSEPCFDKETVIQLGHKTEEYITLWEIAQDNIWNPSTIKEFLRQNGVLVLQQLEDGQDIYNRSAVGEALKGLSCDMGDYYDRTETINRLGVKLFNVAFLTTYYRLEKPYYLKKEVEDVFYLYKELNSIHAVEKYRHSLSWKSRG
ncbi:hypothetical protein FE782_00875 [Paenibacillus antri]|uniref:TniQ domain-containing protein n=1 Tax=Paenibacillus antri TaxID=2582848 RepID=A0A5R9GKD2_9BACL|nr:TniQ family protein [Paenibacillus antri]TLS53938.1 hypothetical protein FE782_00875 [Paenibacillus antri]